MQNSRTQIVATLGPVSNTEAVIEAMIASHLDVVRLNFSWGTHAEHGEFIAKTRRIAIKLGKTVPIIADLSGPREQSESGHQFSGKEGSVITEKDKNDLRFVLSQKVEYVAISYVGGANDILELRSLISEYGGAAKIIAKIEREVAVKNIQAIIDVSDAIMVARGDLGSAIPLETVPFVQKEIIALCNQSSKPVIVATEMMSSMIEREIPARADVTDVAYAVLMGADAVMLSNETAAGKNPVQVVEMMERIALEAERHEETREINPL